MNLHIYMSHVEILDLVLGCTEIYFKKFSINFNFKVTKKSPRLFSVCIYQCLQKYLMVVEPPNFSSEDIDQCQLVANLYQFLMFLYGMTERGRKKDCGVIKSGWNIKKSLTFVTFLCNGIAKPATTLQKN